MSYKNKTFISFASEDIKYYRLMTAWNANKNMDFNFYDAHDLNTARDTSKPETINRRLRERLSNTKQVILLVGDETREKASRTSSFIHYEVQVIRDLGVPVILVNLNKSRKSQSSKIPVALGDPLYTISVPFNPHIIKYALDKFPATYKNNQKEIESDRKKGPYYYKDSVYERLGL